MFPLSSLPSSVPLQQKNIQSSIFLPYTCPSLSIPIALQGCKSTSQKVCSRNSQYRRTKASLHIWQQPHCTVASFAVSDNVISQATIPKHGRQYFGCITNGVLIDSLPVLSLQRWYWSNQPYNTSNKVRSCHSSLFCADLTKPSVPWP